MRRSAGGKVASCLVKLASRCHKIAALAAFHSGKTGLKAAAEVNLSQLSARDAFPKAQLTRMRSQYARGEAVKRAGECRAYRIINPGTADAPELEVRLEENGPWVKYDGEVKSEDEIKREEEDEIKREEEDEIKREEEEDEEHVEDEKHVEDEGQTENEVAILFRSYLRNTIP